MPEPGLVEDTRMSSQITSQSNLLARVLYEQSPVVNVRRFFVAVVYAIYVFIVLQCRLCRDQG